MQPPNKQLLLVDDRIKYSRIISDFFTSRGYLVDHAVTAREGIGLLEERGIGHYRVVVTDITMEHQLAGLELIYYLFKKKYNGTVVMASTGFDAFLGMFFSKLFMGIFGVHYLIPKTTVIKGTFEFYPARPGSRPKKEFVEIAST